MYKLIYKSQFVAGFDEDQILGNLAQLLQLKPKTVRLVFLSGRASVIKILETEAEVEQWRAAFLDAGVYLDVISIAAPDANSIADQIELELELHSLEDDFDDEPPRQLLVKKIIVREDPVEPVPVGNEMPAFLPAIVQGSTESIPSAVTPSVFDDAHIHSEVIEPLVEVETIEPELPAARLTSLEPDEQREELIVDIIPSSQEEKIEAATAAVLPGVFVPVIVNEPNGEELQNQVVDMDAQKLSTDIKREHDDESISAEEQNSENPLPTDSDTAPSSKEKNNQDDIQPNEEYVDVNWHKSSFLWGMLVIVLAIVFTASTILWLKRPLWAAVTTPAQADKVVTALATESLFALAHVDVQRLQQLPDVLQKDTGMKNLPAPDANFWRNLEQAGVDISQQLKHVWIAGYNSNNQTRALWVLNGNFNAEQVRAWLKKNYSIDEDTPQQIVFSSIDINTCEKQPAMMAVIESDRIVLGAPEHVAAFRGRMEAAATAAIDLSDWQRISTGQMLSVALFNPAQFNEPSTTAMLNKLAIEVAPLKGIYIGLSPRLLPPALELSAVLVGTDAQLIKVTNDNLMQAVTNAKNTIGKDWPETLPLYERMKLKPTEQQLRATVFFDEQVQQQVKLWTQSLFAQMLPINNNAPAVEQERVDEKPRVFANLASAQLPEFAQNKHLNNSFVSQTTTGPFGIGISSIESTAQGIVINLDVNAFNLPNLGKEADAIQLRITDIVDHQDQSLIAEASCSPNGVRQAAHINAIYEGAFFDQGQSQSYLGIQGSKKIILPSNINLSSIGAIKGEIEYRLPTSVERLLVNAPLAGKVINSNGMQVRFFSASASSLYYQPEGNTGALLQVNALNADSKVLVATNTVHSESVVDSGIFTTTNVQGKVAAAEVIVANKWEKKVYPFSFGRIQPPEKIFAQDKPTPELLSAAKLKLLKQDSPPSDIKYPYQTPQQTTVAGPALIAVNQLNIFEQKLLLVADIYLRNQHPLTRQLSAVRLVITEVEDSAGNLHPVDIQVPVSLEHQGGSWSEGSYRPDPAQPWLRGQLELRDQELGVSDTVALWGKLIFLAPGEPIAIPIPFQFGMEWNGSGSSLKLSRWEAGRLLFDIHGSFSELMAITALDDTGAVISQAAELRSSLGINQVELPVKQRPASIEFSIARDQQTADFPFEIRAAQ